MSTLLYYLAWLGAGLMATALASAWFARRTRVRLVRRAAALRLLDALARYCIWVASQRQGLPVQLEPHEGDELMARIAGLLRQHFAPLRAQTQRLCDTHAQLMAFLHEQQRLRLSDAETWVMQDGDAQFLALWQRHLEAAEALELALAPWSDPAAEPEADPEPRHIFQGRMTR